MKEKGKTKSEKVGTSLLLTFSLLFFTSTARTEELDLFESNALPGIRDIFLEICKVPRYSSHEVRLGDWLMAWAKAHHFAVSASWSDEMPDAA